MAFSRLAAYLVTASMLAVTIVGFVRWRLLPAPARLIVVNVGISTAAAVGMWTMARAGQLTRVPQEIIVLIDTILLTAAFWLWQTRRAGRVILAFLAAAFVAAWVAVLVAERWAGPVSAVSAPIGNVVKTAAAALTVIERVRVTMDNWTDQLWFWCGVAVMLIFGTEVVLYPAWQSMLGVRDDLIVQTFTFHLLVSVVGYLLIARAFSRAGRLAHPGPARAS